MCKKRFHYLSRSLSWFRFSKMLSNDKDCSVCCITTWTVSQHPDSAPLHTHKYRQTFSIWCRQTFIFLPQTPPPPSLQPLPLTHWCTLVALRRDWGRCVPLNMHRRLSEDHSGTHRKRPSPLLQQERLFCVCVCVCDTVTASTPCSKEHYANQHVFLLFHRVSLHYPEACCLLCIHVTSCSTVCVTHS